MTLQAETFAISGAKIHLEEGQEVDDEGRIDLIRTMADTVDQMFFMFCDIRTSEQWSSDLTAMQDWLKRGRNGKQKAGRLSGWLAENIPPKILLFSVAPALPSKAGATSFGYS